MDSASAQFAASALVTSEQLMGFKMKDDVVLGIGVNGVLPASGKGENSALVPIILVTVSVVNTLRSYTLFRCFFLLPRSIQGLTPQ